MIDKKVVITQVLQGRYPPYWRVYRGVGNNGCATAWGILAVGIFLFALMTLQYFDITLLLFLGILIIICIWIANVCLRRAKANRRSILAILPEGVVQSYAGNIQTASWLYFANIDRIELAQKTEISGIDGDISSQTYYWLDVYCSDGTYLAWGVRDCFGDTAYLGKTIIAAYNHYWNNTR